MTRRARGFSLVEVLVAMAIFTVGATSILALFAAAAATHKRSVDRTRAAMVAEGIVAEVQARYWPGEDLEELEGSVLRELPEKIDGYTWTIFLERPGEEAAGKKAGAPRPPARLLIGKSSKAPRPAPAARKAKVIPGGKGVKDAGTKASEDTGEPSGPPTWTAEEVLLRVEVGWSQSGRAVTESYDTLILPRRPPPEMKPSSKKR